jgi:hypothetical protein
MRQSDDNRDPALSKATAASGRVESLGIVNGASSTVNEITALARRSRNDH